MQNAARLLPKLLKKLFRRLLPVPLRVVLGPPPQIITRILQRVRRLPAELFVRTCRIGSQIKHIALSSANDFVREIPAHRLGECLDHVEDCAASASAQVPGPDTGVVLTEMVDCDGVAAG